MSNRRFGIDLGTTNTCVYYASFSAIGPKEEREESWNITHVNVLYENKGDLMNTRVSHLLPSIVYGRKQDDGKYKYYIGEVAEKMAYSDGASTLINTKRLMCNDDQAIALPFGLDAESVARILLEGCYYSIKQDVKRETTRLSADYCITQPAAFSLFASNSVFSAALKAGIPKEPDPLREPIAALLSYIYEEMVEEKESVLLEKQKKHDNRLLTVVVDIGGGTTDVAIQEIAITGQRSVLNDETTTCTGYVVDFLGVVKEHDTDGGVASTNIEPAFGGLDFDNEILNRVAQRIDNLYFEKTGKRINWEDDGRAILSQGLYKQIKDYKELLSGYSEGTEPELEIALQWPERLECTATAAEVYEWTEALCQRNEGKPHSKKTVYEIIRNTIERSGYKVDDIDFIYVTGGMSSFRPIRTMLKKRFSQLDQAGGLVFSKTPLEDIARGAAVCDTFFKVKMQQSVLFYDLMIDDPCGEPKIIVRANTPLPAADTLEKFMKIRNPAYCYIDVLYGHGPKSDDLRKARSIRQRIPPTAFDSDISVRYSIDEHNNLDMTLIIHRGPKDKDLEIKLIQLINHINLTEGDKNNG